MAYYLYRLVYRTKKFILEKVLLKQQNLSDFTCCVFLLVIALVGVEQAAQVYKTRA